MQGLECGHDPSRIGRSGTAGSEWSSLLHSSFFVVDLLLAVAFLAGAVSLGTARIIRALGDYRFKIKAIDKASPGEVAATVRAFRRPEISLFGFRSSEARRDAPGGPGTPVLVRDQEVKQKSG